MNTQQDQGRAGQQSATYYINGNPVSEAQFISLKNTLTISSNQSGEIEHGDGSTISIYTATDQKGQKYTYSEGVKNGKAIDRITINTSIKE